MTSPEGVQSGWRGVRRPAGLFVITLALSVIQPLLLILIPFAALALTGVRSGTRGWLFGGLALLVALLGPEASGMWNLERGWAILLAGGLAAAQQRWPDQPFFPRAGAALVFALIVSGGWLWVTHGWGQADAIVEARIRSGAGAVLDWVGTLAEAEGGALREAVERTTAFQVWVFPALLGLASLSGMAVASWFQGQLSRGAYPGIGSFRGFRFPDALVWMLILGMGLGVLYEWSSGWGRLGANLSVFMVALYVFRGVAVLNFLTGGFGILGAALLVLGFVLAAPLLLAGAALVGIGDSWLDFRARALRAGGDHQAGLD